MVPALAGRGDKDALRGASEAPVWGFGSPGFGLSQAGASLRDRPVLCVPRVFH